MEIFLKNWVYSFSCFIINCWNYNIIVMFNTGQRTVNNIMKESKKVSKELSKDFEKLVSSKYDKAICPKSKCAPNGGGKKPKLPNYDYKSGNEVWLDNSQMYLVKEIYHQLEETVYLLQIKME